MLIEMRATDAVKPYDRNPRVNDAAVDAVAQVRRGALMKPEQRRRSATWVLAALWLVAASVAFYVYRQFRAGQMGFSAPVSARGLLFTLLVVYVGSVLPLLVVAEVCRNRGWRVRMLLENDAAPAAATSWRRATRRSAPSAASIPPLRWCRTPRTGTWPSGSSSSC